VAEWSLSEEPTDDWCLDESGVLRTRLGRGTAVPLWAPWRPVPHTREQNR